MFDGGRNNGGWTAAAIEVESMASFIDAPAVILTAPDEVRRFPKVLAVVSHPDPSGFLVDAQAPGVAQAVAPIFRARICPTDERVVLWQGVILCSAGMIDIDTQYAPEQIA